MILRKLAFICFMHILLVRTLQRTEDVFIAQSIPLSLNRKIIAVLCKVCREHTVWKNTDFLNVTASDTFCYHRALNC